MQAGRSHSKTKKQKNKNMRAGEAITFFTEDDSGQLRRMANLVKESGGEVPEWMLQLKKGDKDAFKPRLPSGVTAHEAISTLPKMDRIRQKRKQQIIDQVRCHLTTLPPNHLTTLPPNRGSSY